VVTDAPDTQRLTSVSADPFTIGAVAGELLARWQPAGGTVAFFTGWLSMHEHAEKLRGVESSLAAFGGALRLGPVVEAHDDEEEAYRRAVAVLRDHPDLTSIYVSTVNSPPVLRAAEQEGRLSRLTIVTTDLFPELVERIREGTVAATVYQRPVTQGRLALQALCQYLMHGTCPPSRIDVVPHFVMRSNLDLFLRTIPVDLDAPAERLPSASRLATNPRPRNPARRRAGHQTSGWRSARR
jgi:LacI family transcriptional regulator